MKTYDVAIAGGGLIGGTIALELARAGLRVGIFDSGRVGQESSWAGAGILSPAPESQAMIPLVPLAKASLSSYSEFVASVEETSGQNVGYRPKGTLETISSEDVRAELSTVIALHHGLGLKAEALSAEDARELEPALSEEIEAAVLRPEEASVDNRALTAAVLEAARRSGAEIHESSGAQAIAKTGEKCTGLVLETETVAAKWTVIAAGCFSATIAGAEKYAPVRPAKGQMAALRPKESNIERVLWSEKIYLVPRNDGRVLAGATVEYTGFEKDVTAAGIEKLLAGALELVPSLQNAKIEETWAGLRPDSPDHLPILGPSDLDGLAFATGHFRSGILLAPITAKLIREWVIHDQVSTQGNVEWERFSPLRFANLGRAKTV